MTKFPSGLSGQKVRRALERAGFYLKRQRGSHKVLRRHLEGRSGDRAAVGSC